METKNQETKKKSFKEVIVDNRGKIITAVSVSVISILLYDRYKDKLEISWLKGSISKYNDRINIMESAIVEGGIIDQARATVIRKRDYQIGKLKSLENRKEVSDQIKNAIDKIKGSIEAYDIMLEKYDELERAYDIE